MPFVVFSATYCYVFFDAHRTNLLPYIRDYGWIPYYMKAWSESFAGIDRGGMGCGEAVSEGTMRKYQVHR